MAEWTNIPDGSLELGQPARSIDAFAFRDNPVAIAEGASGAPRVQNGALQGHPWGTSDIQSGAITRTRLSHAQGVVSVSDDTEIVNLPGGEWGFCPQTRSLVTGLGNQVGHLIGRAQVDSGNWQPEEIDSDTDWRTFITLHAASGCTAEARQRYIQSSPPYDHGDGPVQGYIYARVDSAGTVRSLYMAEDPPWYGHSGDEPREVFERDGRVYGRFLRPRACCVDADRMTKKAFREAFGVCDAVEEEITPATKLRGMERHPHPFVRPSDHVTLLLDPMSELVGRLLAAMQSGDDVTRLFGRYLKINNTKLKRSGPPGVPVHGVAWR